MKKAKLKLWKISPTFMDSRGIIADILEDRGIKHVGIIISLAGSTRGNHYHKKATQWTYVIGGKIKIYTKELKSKNSKIESFVMNPGDMVELPAYTIHAVDALKKSTLLILTNKSRKNNSYEYDTFRIKIV